MGSCHGTADPPNVLIGDLLHIARLFPRWKNPLQRRRAFRCGHGSRVTPTPRSPAQRVFLRRVFARRQDGGRRYVPKENASSGRFGHCHGGKELRRLEADGGQPPDYIVDPVVAYSPDGKTMAAGTTNKCICVWDAATGKEICRLQGHEKIVLSLAYSPDGASFLPLRESMTRSNCGT